MRSSLYESPPLSLREEKAIREALQEYASKRRYMQQSSCATDDAELTVLDQEWWTYLQLNNDLVSRLPNFCGSGEYQELTFVSEIDNIQRIVEIEHLLRDILQNDKQLPRTTLLDMDLRSPSYPNNDLIDILQSRATTSQPQHPMNATVDYSRRHANRQLQIVSGQQWQPRGRLRHPSRNLHTRPNVAAQKHRASERRRSSTTRATPRTSPRNPPSPRPRPPNSNKAYDPEYIFWIRYHKEDLHMKWDEINQLFSLTFPNAGRNTIQCLQSRYYRDNHVPELDSMDRVVRDSNGKIVYKNIKVRQRNAPGTKDLGAPSTLVEKHPWRAVQYRWVNEEHRREARRILAGGEAGGGKLCFLFLPSLPLCPLLQPFHTAHNNHRFFPKIQTTHLTSLTAKGAKWRKVLREIEIERYRQFAEEEKAKKARGQPLIH